MTQERLTGPQQVATAAHRILACPHMETTPGVAESSLVADLVTEGGGLAARILHRFALEKVVTDELADRLPHMRVQFPPYGLPEKHQTDGSGWRPVDKLRPISGDYEPIQARLAGLKTAYTAKITLHVSTELENMYPDPAHHLVMKTLAGKRIPALPGQTETPVERVFDKVGVEAVESQDILFGLMAVAPKVLENELLRKPTHDEVIAVLRRSKRLPILASLLSRGQLQSLLVAITPDSVLNIQPWGFDFDPTHFTIFTDKRNDTDIGIDYKGGIGSILVPAYDIDFGEFVDERARFSKVVVDHSRPSQRLEETGGIHQALTCPARKFIGAVLEDIIDIADRVRLYDIEE